MNIHYVDTSMGVWVGVEGSKMIKQNLYDAELRWSWILSFPLKDNVFPMKRIKSLMKKVVY